MDESARVTLEEEATAAKQALDEHDQQGAALQEAAEQAKLSKEAAVTALRTFNTGISGLSESENRIKSLRQRIERAVAEERGFDAEQQRETYRKKLLGFGTKKASIIGKVCGLQAQINTQSAEEVASRLGLTRTITPAPTPTITHDQKPRPWPMAIAYDHDHTPNQVASRLAHSVAKEQLREVHKATKELSRQADPHPRPRPHPHPHQVHETAKELSDQVDAAKREREAIDAEVKSRNELAAKKRMEARKAAPHFESSRDRELDGEARQEWDELPSDIDDLEGELAALEKGVACLAFIRTLTLPPPRPRPRRDRLPRGGHRQLGR